MYPTIIFALSLLLSIMFVIGIINDYRNNRKFTIYEAIVAIILWSWLFYLLH